MSLVAPVPKDLFELGLKGRWFEDLRRIINGLDSTVTTHIADTTIHFTVASIDHGLIAGLGDNDHPHYVLKAGDTMTGNLLVNAIIKPYAERGTVSLVSTNTTLTHTVTLVKQTANGITTTLWASPTIGDKVTIRNRGGGSNTIGGNGTNIEGSATQIIYDDEDFDLVYDGTEWLI